MTHACSPLNNFRKKFPKNESSRDLNDLMVQIIFKNYNLFMKIDENLWENVLQSLSLIFMSVTN